MTISSVTSKIRLTAMVAILLFVDSFRAQNVFREEESPATVQLRTNGLYDLAACPNLGLEIQTDLGLAFQFDYIGAWWYSDNKHRYWQNYGFQSELRYYLSSKSNNMPYNGHHVGVYGQMATYDFEFGGTGYQCNTLDKSWGIGVAYGYRKPLNRHFSLDFTLGLGYFESKYTQYIPYADWYLPTHYKKLTWIGPTRLEVSLVWNINNKNY